MWNSIEKISSLDTFFRWTILFFGTAAIFNSNIFFREASLFLSAVLIVLGNRKSQLQKEKNSPRKLTQHQRSILSDSIKKIGISEISVTGLMGDSESHQFAEDLSGFLEELGFSIPENSFSLAQFTKPVFGIEAWAHPDDCETLLKPLMFEFYRAGIHCNAIRNPEVKNGNIQIIVGTKD
jgi:hypothetical protein